MSSACSKANSPARNDSTQYHITPKDRALAAKLGVTALDYDGVAEVWVDSFEDWQEVVSDKEFLATIFRMCLGPADFLDTDCC
jgi:hypothetical protein